MKWEKTKLTIFRFEFRFIQKCRPQFLVMSAPIAQISPSFLALCVYTRCVIDACRPVCLPACPVTLFSNIVVVSSSC